MSNLSEPTSISVVAGLIALCVCALTAKGITHLSPLSGNVAQDRFACIDGLRGLLALGVFLHHYVITYHFHLTGKWAPAPSAFYTLSGKVAVPLFFIVTGFLFWNKLLTSQGQPDWAKLYISRIFRLVPIYWLVVTAVCILVILLGGTKLRVSLPSLLKSLLMWLSFQGAPDINAFRNTSRIVASVTWTLKYEWMFYISLPLLGMVLRIARKTKMALWMLGICVATVSVMGITIPFIGIKTRYCMYFLVGAIAAAIHDISLLRKVAQSKIGSCVAIACMLLLFTMFGKGYGKWQTLVMAVFFCCVALGNSLFGMLRLRALVCLGEISYSVYLLHGLLLYVCFSLLFPDFMNAARSLFQVSLGMSVVGSLLVLLSWITFSAIERPFMRFGKSIAGYVSRDTGVGSKGV